MEEYGPVSHVVTRVAHAHANAASPLRQQCGLCPGQELLLMCLREKDHQSQTSLARALRLDPLRGCGSTLARLLAVPGLVTVPVGLGDQHAAGSPSPRPPGGFNGPLRCRSPGTRGRP